MGKKVLLSYSLRIYCPSFDKMVCGIVYSDNRYYVPYCTGIVCGLSLLLSERIFYQGFTGLLYIIYYI